MSNPFDDNVFDASVTSVRHRQTSTNPFTYADDPSIASIQSSSVAVDDGFIDDINATGSVSDAPAEASWQYLGDLPYRRVQIYSNITWNRRGLPSDEHSNNTQNGHRNTTSLLQNQGLANFPSDALKYRSKNLDQKEFRTLLSTTTHTIVRGCPNGGPVAAMTLPIVGNLGSSVSGFVATQINIWTNSGKSLAQFEFPPVEYRENSLNQLGTKSSYTAADVLTMGFTSRTTLIVVLRDSFCFTYNISGDFILRPFYILPRTENTGVEGNVSTSGTELLLAHVYEGGVAVLAANKDSALVELLDEHDDAGYAQSAHISTRKIFESGTFFRNTNSYTTDNTTAPSRDNATSTHYALVTVLPTGSFSSKNFCHYCCIAVLPRFYTASRHPEVFLSTSDHSVITIDSATLDVTDVNCRQQIPSPIVEMCFAPNGRFLACFTESSVLTVISTSFETKVLDFDTSEGSNLPPLEMKWCGEDSVVLHWKNLGVLMIGPYGDWLRFPYDGVENLFIVPEIDCCRVVTDTSIDILQRVPPATALLLRIGSIEASAMLLDAADAFHAGSPASDEAIRSLLTSGLLLEAIEACTDSAVKEFDIYTQKRLLRAASYGMHFSYKTLETDNRELNPLGEFFPVEVAPKFVAAARKLRVLNALRNPNVGFILTSAQFDSITATGIIARLIAMKRPALAAALCKYLSLPKSVQLFCQASKAAAFVESNPRLPESEIVDAVVAIINGKANKFGNNKTQRVINRGAYAMVAIAAQKAGRATIANQLMVFESSVADKIPALISFGNYSDAISVATKARDFNFIFSILMECERTCTALGSSTDISKAQNTFLSSVVSSFTTEAFHVLRCYLTISSNVKTVTNLLLRAQKFVDAGEVVARRGCREQDYREKQGMLSEACRIFGLGKETTFQKSCTEEYIELLKDQDVIRNKYENSDACCSTSSVATTIGSVLKFAATNVREQHRLFVDADKLAKKYRVAEKRLWYIKVKAFAESNQWSNLRILAESKSKPPIGFKPFAKAAIKGKLSSTETHRYIERVTIPVERYDLFCEASLWSRALEEARLMKDVRRLLNVKTLCNSPELALLADQIMGGLA